MTTVQHTTKGIQDLLDTLRSEGIEEGQNEAQRIVEEARHEAKQIRLNAKQEAESLAQQTRDEIHNMRKSCDQSLELAVRDSLLRLRSEIESHFASQIRLLVQNEMRDDNRVGQWLERIVEHLIADENNGCIEITVAEQPDSASGGSFAPSDTEKDRLAQYVSTEMLDRGITIKTSSRIESGFIVRRVKDGVEIHFETETLSALLSQHLLPRFRYLLENGPEQTGE